MKEDLLQYIWKFQYYNSHQLMSTDGDQIQVIHPGTHNTNQGADFTQAKIKINETIWAGNIELHINSSHWNLHGHSADNNFNNIILHVVWNCDIDIKDTNGNNLPTLELQSRVSKVLLDKYRQLMDVAHFIPCEKQVPQVNELTLANWKQRLVAERLITRSQNCLDILKETNYHWEETFWWLIAANFGLKVNSEVFQEIAKTLPLTVLTKHKNSITQIEALLFGQAGLLKKEFSEKYPAMLWKEYLFYQKKYKLLPVDGKLYFLRMRPANFPTIRLGQLAVLIHESEHLFSKIKEANSVTDVKKMFSVAANDYWHYHYVFDEESDYKIKTLGSQMVDNIIINTVVPMLFSYGLHHQEESYKTKAISWLEEVSPERNVITREFENLGFANKNAFDSQAFLQLKNEYCNHKLCLQCTIGNSLLKKAGY
ncbi:MAG: DUF2851 family protein [Bacteroidota bacterium]|nr:DUF2851 family protein [Bacteroidota bacterium]